MKKNILLIFVLFFSLAKLYSNYTKIADIHSASEYDYPPFCIVTEDSIADGFSVELLKAACEAMKINVDFKVGAWSKIKQELADGMIDVLPLVGRTPEREDIYDFTFPYLTFHGAVFARSGEKRIKSLDDLKNMSIMVLKGDNSEEYVKREKLSSKIISVSTSEDAFKALENGECDAVIAQKVMGLQLIDQLKLENIAPLNIKLDGFQQNFCFAVTEGNSELLSKLNEGLSIIIANGTFERLQKKWFSPRVDFKQTRLIIGGDKNYPPYEYLDENGEPAGYNIDLIKAIAKNLGILIEIKLGVWSDVREELSNGAIDVLPGMFYTQERDKYFDFSPPHLIIDHAIVTRKSSDKINDITELRGKSILVEKDDVMHDYLLKNGFDNQIKTSENVEEALVVLSKGQYDCAIIARRAAQYCISKNKLVNLRVNKNSYFSQEYCFAGKEGNEYLIGHLYDALSEIKASGEYKKIYDKWFGEYEPAKINYSRIIKYSIMVLILLILMIIVIVLWNRMLSRKVQAKTNELSERESLLFGIFDNMSSGSGVYKVINNGEKGSDYIVKFFNRKSLEIEGKELNEVIGKSLFELRPKIDEYGLIDLMKKVWQTGKSEFFPSSVYIDENYNNYYENFVFKLPSGDVVTIYNDVTDKRIAEITIKESEEKYRNLVETASDAIYLMDDKGIIIETNISACNMLGKTKNKIIGTSIGQIEPSLPIDDFLEFWVDKDFNKNFTVETTHIRKDGTLIPVEVSTMKYKQNNTVLYYGIARDITERKIDETVKMDNLLELEKNKKATMNLLKDLKLENDQRKNAENDLKSLNEDLEWKVNERTKQLENQNEDTIKAQESLVLLLEDVNDSRKELKDAINKLYKSNSDLEAFSYSVSHDLRSPLRGILGFTEILKEDYKSSFDDEGRRVVNRIIENSKRMQNLIDDLLEYSRVGRSNLRHQQVDIKNMIQKKFKELNTLEEDRNIDFYLDDNLPIIKADSILCEQMFENLLSNAIKFTSKKEVSEINIKYKQNNDFDIISIEDNGAGFDDKYKHKLFNVFQRLHSSEEFPGTGVGLSIVHKIASLHGWIIEAESEINKGTTFYIKIPRKIDTETSSA